MKILKIILMVVVVALVVVALIAPIGPLPGFFIGGTATAAPNTWPDTSDTDEIILKVNGTLPRAVIIWVVDHQGELYVVGSKESGWVSMLGDGAPVEMRLEDKTYGLNAVAVVDDWQSVLGAYVDKYRADYPEIINGFPPIEEAAGQIGVFRLER